MLAATARSQTSGNELTSLLPTHSDWWCAVVADVFSSGAVSNLEDRLNDEMLANGEYRYFTIDGSRKPSFTLLGQAPYTAKRSVPATQAIDRSKQKHVVITGRGKTSAPLLVELESSESVGNIARTCAKWLTPAQRNQVEFVMTDNPSCALFL